MPIYAPMVIRGRGGQLPEYQRRSDVYTPGEGRSGRLDDSAARIAAQSVGVGEAANARALMGLGDSIQRLADTGFSLYDQYSKDKALEKITEYRTAMNTALYGENGILTQKGEEAFSVDAQRAECAKSLKERILKDANDRVKRYFNIKAFEYDADSSVKAQQYAQKERYNWRLHTYDAAAKERMDFAIANYSNPGDFGNAVGSALSSLEQGYRLQGYSGEALAYKLKEAGSGIFKSAIEQALASKDIAGAERLLSMGSSKSGRAFSYGGAAGAAANYVGDINTDGIRAKMPANVVAKIETEAKRQGVDPNVALAMAYTESNGRQDRISKAGAVGVMQVMPKYVNDFGGGDPHNLDDNIRLGITEIKTYLQRYGGDLDKALRAYNWGPGNVDAWLQTGKGIHGQDMPAEARNYVGKVRGYMGQRMEGGGGVAVGSGMSGGNGNIAVGGGMSGGGMSGRNGMAAIDEKPTLGADTTHMTAKDMTWARVKIEEAKTSLAAKEKANTTKAINEALKGLKQATEQAEVGDTEQLEGIAATLRQLGENERADKLMNVVQDCIVTRNVRQIAATKPIPEVLRIMNDTQKLMDISEKNKDAASYKSNKAALKAMQQVVQGRLKAYKADPAAAAEKEAAFSLPDNPTFVDRLEQRLKVQQDNMVADPKLLTKTEINYLGDRFTTLSSSIAFHKQIEKEFGKFSNSVLQELVKAKKLPNNAQILMSMDPANAELLMQASGKHDDKTLEKALGLGQADINDLNNKIRENCVDLLSTFHAQGNTEMTASLLDSAYRLALKNIERGMDKDDAASRAAGAVLTDRYTLGDGYRIPKEFDGESVIYGLDVWLKDFAEKGDIQTYEKGLTKKQIAVRKKNLLSKVKFITNDDESGVYPILDGAFLLDNNNNPIQVKFSDLVTLGVKRLENGKTRAWEDTVF